MKPRTAKWIVDRVEWWRAAGRSWRVESWWPSPVPLFWFFGAALGGFFAFILLGTYAQPGTPLQRHSWGWILRRLGALEGAWLLVFPFSFLRYCTALRIRQWYAALQVTARMPDRVLSDEDEAKRGAVSLDA